MMGLMTSVRSDNRSSQGRRENTEWQEKKEVKKHKPGAGKLLPKSHMTGVVGQEL